MKFSFLFPKTRGFLENYSYIGECAPEFAAPVVLPGVLVFTIDMKAPHQGPPKFLEFNGVGSP